MKIKLAPIGAVILLLCASCNQAAEETSTGDSTSLTTTELQALDRDVAQTYKTEDFAGAVDSTVSGNGQQQGNPVIIRQAAANPDWDKKIVKTGRLTVEVEDFNKYYSLLRDAVKKSGGYVAAEQQGRSEYRLENVVTVKVPVAQFEEAIGTLSNVTGKDKVVERNISSQDVTTEVVDTKSRMEAKREVRLRYLELLRQANKMDDILKVQNEINDIQEQIEMANGRVNYLNHASAMSTIELTFYQVLNPAVPEPTDPTFSDKLWMAFEKGWGFIKNIILAIITIWPLLLGGVVLWVLFKKKVVRNFRDSNPLVAKVERPIDQ